MKGEESDASHITCHLYTFLEPDDAGDFMLVNRSLFLPVTLLERALPPWQRQPDILSITLLMRRLTVLSMFSMPVVGE